MRVWADFDFDFFYLEIIVGWRVSSARLVESVAGRHGGGQRRGHRLRRPQVSNGHRYSNINVRKTSTEILSNSRQSCIIALSNPCRADMVAVN